MTRTFSITLLRIFKATNNIIATPATQFARLITGPLSGPPMLLPSCGIVVARASKGSTVVGERRYRYQAVNSSYGEKLVLLSFQPYVATILAFAFLLTWSRAANPKSVGRPSVDNIALIGLAQMKSS